MSVQILADIINNSSYVVFFGGAGVSTESGIPDFRSQRVDSASGLCSTEEQYGLPPEQLLSRDCFLRKPELFFRYYKENLIHKDATPNAAHKALAALEERNQIKCVITQNVDGLHQEAGSKNVFELHGSNRTQYCVECNRQFALEYILEKTNCDGFVPKCSCGGIVRPDVVLYGEALNQSTVSAAVNAIRKADSLIVGGTSLVVYPAAGLIQYFRGPNLVLINKDKTVYDDHATLVINESIGSVLGLVGSG